MIDRQKIIKGVVRYVAITLGCLCLAAGIALFLNPNNISTGGISGIAIILNKFIPVSTGLLILILNIPLLIIGLVVFGKDFLFSTVYATVVLSLATDLITFLGTKFGIVPLTNDLFLAAIFGGILSALGIGTVFRFKGTTGGLDIVVMLIHKKYRYLGVGSIFLIADFLIAGITAIVFKNLEFGLYACVSVIVYSVLMDRIVYGGNGAKFIYIVSDNPEKITARILSELEIGVTYVEGVGAYTSKNKQIIMCVVKKHLYPNLRDIVRDEDPEAFMIVSAAQDVYGLGYRSHHEEL